VEKLWVPSVRIVKSKSIILISVEFPSMTVLKEIKIIDFDDVNRGNDALFFILLKFDYK